MKFFSGNNLSAIGIQTQFLENELKSQRVLQILPAKHISPNTGGQDWGIPGLAYLHLL